MTRFRRLPDAALLALFRAWETELTPVENEQLLEEMARRGMTGEEVLDDGPVLAVVTGGSL